MRLPKFLIVGAFPCALALVMAGATTSLQIAPAVVSAHGNDDQDLNQELRAKLAAAGFTGDIERQFGKRIKQSLGRPINPKLAELGRLLWFDKGLSLGRDNTCGGCHSPTHGMGDSQPMAIGVQNNNIVGPGRTGPRNQRRTPTVVNNALYPRLMWNSRFESLSGDPFDGSQGFSFPPPEDNVATPFMTNPVRFSAAENEYHDVRHLLQAQAHMPPTELIEVGGFNGACADPAMAALCQFDVINVPGPAQPLPAYDADGFRNEPIRQLTLETLNGSATYRRLFGQVFREVRRDNAPIDFFMFGKAIAEFEFTLVFANAPIDQFARGNHNAMTESEKKGALTFFGKANCASCHKVDGQSNEMFSDFKEHVVGVPQVAPVFGHPTGNFPFAGPGGDEDFGRMERTGAEADRYKFRTAPLRNLAVSPAFFHNGAYANLEDAIRFHLNVVREARTYDPEVHVPADLRQVGPRVPKKLIDPLLKNAIKLTDREFRDLVAFVKTGLLDERVKKENLCALIPASVPSGAETMVFEGCPAPRPPRH